MALKTEEKMQNSYDSFSRSLEEKYPAYPDFIKPVQDAIAQVNYNFFKRYFARPCLCKCIFF